MEIIKTPHGGLWQNPDLEQLVVRQQWFDPHWWRSQGLVTGQATGRGSVIFVRHAGDHWALRHYQRGGLVGRFNHDRYLYTGLPRVRSMAEAELLRQLNQWALPTAVPVAASYQRVGAWYRADLITRRLDYRQTLAERLGCDTAQGLEQDFEACGRVIGEFHRRGVCHADLNCHNLLLARSRVYLIDLDRGSLRGPGAWQAANLARLKRSAEKVVSPALRPALEGAWAALERGYRG